MYLRRYHDIMISCTGVFRILKRLHMNRLPNHEGQRRYMWRFDTLEKDTKNSYVKERGKSCFDCQLGQKRRITFFLNIGLKQIHILLRSLLDGNILTCLKATVCPNIIGIGSIELGFGLSLCELLFHDMGHPA